VLVGVGVGEGVGVGVGSDLQSNSSRVITQGSLSNADAFLLSTMATLLPVQLYQYRKRVIFE